MRRLIYSIVAFAGLSGLVGSDLKDGFMEATINELERSDRCVLVATFKWEGIPATQAFPKGLLVRWGRIVRVLKGDSRVGDEIRFTSVIENWPAWLSVFELPKDATLSFLIFDSSKAEEQEGITIIRRGSHWIVDYNDEVFRDYIKDAMGFVE